MPVTLDGDTLGARHKHYNQLLKTYTEDKVDLKKEDLNTGDDDLRTLMSIDVAANNRDVDYLFQVLKSKDLLYVSRALKRSVWLVTDPAYAHLINYQYLQTHLFPHMTVKAKTLLLKLIRYNIKDEQRAEEFYKQEEKPDIALKWLPNCSDAFVQQNIPKYYDKNLKKSLCKRLVTKSKNTLNLLCENDTYKQYNYLESTKFLLTDDGEKYLDLLEKCEKYYCKPRYGKRATDFLMKTFPARIKDKITFYAEVLHMPTLVKYLTTAETKTILYALAKEDHRVLRSFDKFKLFVNVLPDEERFDFIKQVFINKIHTEKDDDEKSDKYGMRKLYCIINPRIPKYRFYEFATFPEAFTEITKMLSEPQHASSMESLLSVLINCTRNNLQDIQKLLSYYREKHRYVGFDKKYDFVENLVSFADFHRFDETTWNMLDDIYTSMDVYIETDVNKQTCLESILIYKLLHNATVPAIIEKQLKIHSFEKYQRKLNKTEKDKLFEYLYRKMFNNLNEQSVTNKEDFDKAVRSLNDLLQMLCAWNKDLINFPDVLHKIKEFIEVNRVNSWEISLKSLYDAKKSWKKYLFTESLELSPSQEVCINVLKHDSTMITPHKQEVDSLIKNDKISMTRFLRKTRIYWPESLANNFKELYLGRLNETEGHIALVRGLCALLPREQILDIIQRYAPKQAEIDFDNINERDLGLQRQIAKKMHFARPQPPPNMLIPYARGDYLKYALPSVLAIYYNLNADQTRQNISNLLDAPVSMQKHGIRIVFDKFSANEAVDMFVNIWKNTKNASIRAVVFKLMFNILCKYDNSEKLKTCWKCLEEFIDSLSFKENKVIYELLKVGNVKKVPELVRAEYLVKSYNFIKRFIPTIPENDRYEYVSALGELAIHTKELLKSISEEFVVNLLTEYIEIEFLKFENSSLDDMKYVLTGYVLSTEKENVQIERYRKMIAPLLERCLLEETGRKKIAQLLIDSFQNDLEYVIKNNFVVPVAVYSDIQKELKKLPVAENYVMIVKWDLIVEITKLVDKHKAQAVKDGQYNFNSMIKIVAPEFGDLCRQLLKEHVNTYFPCIYLLFVNCLNWIFMYFITEAKYVVYKRIIKDLEFTEGYLALINLLPLGSPYLSDDEKELLLDMKKDVAAHPSVEVKIHYNHKVQPCR